MSHMAYIPIDDGARDGDGHCLRADDGSLHSGRWNAELGCFTYGSARHGASGQLVASNSPIQKPIVAYCARVPGNHPETRTA